MEIKKVAKEARGKKYVAALPGSLKLTTNLVPRPLWGQSAAKRTYRAVWQGIRKATFEAAHQKCSICGAAPGSLHCHEIWKYDDSKRIAELVGLVSICKACHGVIHIGWSKKEGKGPEAIRHLCKVNDIDAATAEKVVRRAFSEWTRRSARKWEVRVSAPILQAHPQLASLESNPHNGD